MKKKISAESFIGWKSEDGLLEVVDLVEKCKRTTFKVICHKCKEDRELFPQGYFIITKDNLIINKRKPCGCGRHPRWSASQFLILASRAGEGRLIVNGFAEEFHGQNTKIHLECIKDGYKWTASIHNVITNYNGCPRCAGNERRTEQQAFEKCKNICKTEKYEPIGFIGSYKNCDSRFEYRCLKHGIQDVSFDKFVNKGTRCKFCWKERQKEINSGFYGYYPARKDEQDFLYILNFNDKFIKVGRSFDVNERIKSLRTESKVPIKKIHKLRIFTATHQEIYDLEQELHGELRERNFQHYVDWSTECFENDCIYGLNNLLDNCGLLEVFIE